MCQDFPGGSDGKESEYSAGSMHSIPGSARCPGEGMVTHSSTLAWRIPWAEHPGSIVKSRTQLSEYYTDTHVEKKYSWHLEYISEQNTIPFLMELPF